MGMTRIQKMMRTKFTIMKFKKVDVYEHVIVYPEYAMHSYVSLHKLLWLRFAPVVSTLTLVAPLVHLAMKQQPHVYAELMCPSKCSGLPIDMTSMRSELA